MRNDNGDYARTSAMLQSCGGFRLTNHHHWVGSRNRLSRSGKSNIQILLRPALCYESHKDTVQVVPELCLYVIGELA